MALSIVFGYNMYVHTVIMTLCASDQNIRTCRNAIGKSDAYYIIILAVYIATDVSLILIPFLKE